MLPRLFKTKLRNCSTHPFNQWRTQANKVNMATSAKIQLRPEDVGIMNFGKQSQETAKKASELLQQNHNKHHIFFNEAGFHNHIVHHILSLYGVGASSSIIQKQYDSNTTYQLPQLPIEERIIEDMSDPEKFKKFLGDGKYYQDFLIFFQRAIEEKGWEEVLKEFLWSDDEKGDDMLVRLFAGLLHPLIHLGFGIEFNQPAIIAEALAQAACHGNNLANFYFEAEKAAATTASSSETPSPSLIDLLHEIRTDQKLSTATQWEDENKIRDGILFRAPDEMIKYASKWIVNGEAGEDELERKTVEMIQAVVYFTAAAQRPPKEVKFDFFYMHSLNSSIFFPTFTTLPFLNPHQKSRLLEWKARTDLLNYAARNSPPLPITEIENYNPKNPPKNPSKNHIENGNTTTDNEDDETWKPLFNRASIEKDDGHIVKLIRAVRYGKEASRKFENSSNKVKLGDGGDWLVIKGDMWEKIGNMAIDSVEDIEATRTKWVRGAGFEEAWSAYGDRVPVGGGGEEENGGVEGVEIGNLKI